MIAENNKLEVTLPSDNEVCLTRVLNAPADLVFEAWTKPEHVSKWFGLHGSTLPVGEIDLRVGGSYRYLIREADGTEMAMHGEFTEIERPTRLVYTEIIDMFEEAGGAGHTTMTLEERDGRTIVTSVTAYRDKEVRDAVIQYGMEEGAGVTFDRLEAHLATMIA